MSQQQVNQLEEKVAKLTIELGQKNQRIVELESQLNSRYYDIQIQQRDETIRQLRLEIQQLRGSTSYSTVQYQTPTQYSSQTSNQDYRLTQSTANYVTMQQQQPYVPSPIVQNDFQRSNENVIVTEMRRSNEGILRSSQERVIQQQPQVQQVVLSSSQGSSNMNSSMRNSQGERVTQTVTSNVKVKMYDQPRLVVGGTGNDKVKYYDRAANIDNEVIRTEQTNLKPTHHHDKVNIEIMDHGPVQRTVIDVVDEVQVIEQPSQYIQQVVQTNEVVRERVEIKQPPKMVEKRELVEVGSVVVNQQQVEYQRVEVRQDPILVEKKQLAEIGSTIVNREVYSSQGQGQVLRSSGGNGQVQYTTTQQGGMFYSK